MAKRARPVRVESYGFEGRFERALTAGLCLRPALWGRIGGAIEFESLDDPSNRLLVQAASAIALDNGRGPSSGAVVLQRIARWVDEGRVRRDDLLSASDALDDGEDAGIPPTDDLVAEAAPVLRGRANKNAVSAAFETYSAGGDLTEIAEAIRRAEAIGVTDSSVGQILSGGTFDQLATLRHMDRLSLGVDDLDLALGGGAHRGTLTTWAGPPGGGKSIALGHVAVTSLVQGLGVGLATLELPEEVLLGRAIASLTECLTTDIMAGPPHDARARQRLGSLTGGLGALVVKEFAPGVTVIEEVWDWFDAVPAQLGGRKLDVLLVDYGDKITARNVKARHDIAEPVWTGLRVGAKERGIWAHTASQVRQRPAGMKAAGLYDEGDLSDSSHKAKITDLLITLNPRNGDSGERFLIAYVPKNRLGPAMQKIGPFEAAFEFGRLCHASALPSWSRRNRYDGV